MSEDDEARTVLDGRQRLCLEVSRNFANISNERHQKAVSSLCRLLADDHKLCLGMMTGLTFWVRRLVASVEDIALRDAAGRLARYLIELSKSKAEPDGTVRLPSMKRHVASHLNLTSETFSRTLRRLTEAGLIAEAGRSRVRIVHPRKLRQVAEGMFPKL